MKHYDVIIIGAGPAGIFSALELLSHNKKLRILLLEKGKDIEARVCPTKADKVACRTCPECSLLCGWGGAGAFSDGKLTLSRDIGGNLSKYVDDAVLQDLINYTDEIYLRYGAPSNVYGGGGDKNNALKKQGEKKKIIIMTSPA